MASPAKLHERRDRLRPACVVNDIQHVGTMDVAQPLDLVGIHPHIRPDRTVFDRCAGGANREDLVAAVVIRNEHGQPPTTLDEREKQVIDSIAGAIERDPFRRVEGKCRSLVSRPIKSIGERP